MQLDGSYCNYTAYGITGDSWRDPTYPDTHKGGYKGKLQCGVYTPAKVISISYGEAEDDIPMRYDKRQCSEWMKLVSSIVANISSLNTHY
jgi:tripeptidyl-peptidase I